MTTDSSPATPFTDCVKVLRPEQCQLLLGLPHFITYLIAGADGEIDHWELVLVLEAIDETELISPDFGSCRDSYQVELAAVSGQNTEGITESCPHQEAGLHSNA